MFVFAVGRTAVIVGNSGELEANGPGSKNCYKSDVIAINFISEYVVKLVYFETNVVLISKLEQCFVIYLRVLYKVF